MLKKLFVISLVLVLGWGFVNAEDKEEENVIDSSLINRSGLIGVGYSFSSVEGSSKLIDISVSENFLIPVNSYFTLIPRIEVDLVWGISSSGYPGFRFQGGFLIESKLAKRIFSKARMGFLAGFGLFPTKADYIDEYGMIMTFKGEIFFDFIGLDFAFSGISSADKVLPFIRIGLLYEI